MPPLKRSYAQYLTSSPSVITTSINRPYKQPRFSSKYTKTVSNNGNTRTYVPRSVGNPLAVTERKYFDAEYSNAVTAVTTSWAGCEADPTTLNTLFAPSLGTDYNNRNGRKVSVLAVKIRGHIVCANQLNQTAAEFPSSVRMLCILDQQTNATQFNAEDVLSSGAASQAANMFQNPAFFGRFKVLRDKRFKFENPGISWDGTNLEQNGLIKNFEWVFKFKKPIVVHYNSTNGGTVADVIDKSFHIMCGTYSSLLAPQLDYKVRTTFMDI